MRIFNCSNPEENILGINSLEKFFKPFVLNEIALSNKLSFKELMDFEDFDRKRQIESSK
mgnify:CR=1 FL=1